VIGASCLLRNRFLIKILTYASLVVILLFCQSFLSLMAMDEKEREIDPDQILLSVKRSDGSPKATKPPKSPRTQKQPDDKATLLEALRLEEESHFNKVRENADKAFQKYLRQKQKKTPKQSAAPPAPASAK
jgi:hypothetical protein